MSGRNATIPAARLLMLGLALLCTGPARAGVTLVEDEVIFSLRQPGAKTVFLVGDFNNWNPTVAKMIMEEDRFVISLFLVEGDYRYKFVVDGQWIHDPDNPPHDPSLGSPLFLAEQNDMLIFKIVGADGVPSDVKVEPAVRYIGDFRWAEDQKARAGQIVDLDMDIRTQTFTSDFTFTSIDDSWSMSPFDADITLTNGRLDLQLKKARFAAFKGDTSWVSADPFHLFGYRGIYDLEFGYDDKGAAVELPFSKTVQVNAVYADRLGHESAPGAAAFPGSVITGLAGRAAADTALYAWAPGFGDQDVFGFEARLALGEFRTGYLLRINRGAHPGLENRIVKADSVFTTTAFLTFEDWYAHVFWGSAELFGRIRATAGVGWSDTYLRRNRRTVATGASPQAVDIGRDAPAWHGNTGIQDSRRLAGSLRYETRRFRGEIEAEHHTVRFEPVLSGPATADRFQAGFTGQVRRPAWLGAVAFGYTEQDYGDSPAAFHFDSAERNYWLDGADRFRPEQLAGLGANPYSVIRAMFSMAPRPFMTGGAFNFFDGIPDSPGGPGEGDQGTRPSLLAELGGTMENLVGPFQYGYLRLMVDQPLRHRLYLQADSRGAFYDKPLWGGRKRFISFYLETGYRSGWGQVSAGFGFDPVILDSNRNDYYDIGRTELLTGAVDGGFDRHDSIGIGRRLLDLERRLESDRTLKLECILLF